MDGIVRRCRVCFGISGNWAIGSGSFRNRMSKPVKHSVAVIIRSGHRILALRRADTDDELPGIWGLPAASFGETETLGQVIGRIGRDKLGVALVPLQKISEGVQNRPAYRLE